MASSSEHVIGGSMSEHECVCQICIENYTNPRYIPTCGHTFCENCLYTYTCNLQQEESKFECPVCRKPFGYPDDSDVTLDWIQKTFPFNTVIITMMESLSLSGTKQGVNDETEKCGPCTTEGTINLGEKFCIDCKEVLCNVCVKHHQKFKMSIHHKLINLKEMPDRGRRSEFLDSFTKCANHPEREIEVYCKDHNILVCFGCLTTGHTRCSIEDISIQTDHADESKLREKAEQVTSKMRSLVEDLNTLQKIRIENKNNLKEKLKEIKENIKNVRDQVVEMMDNVVSHVTNVTKQIEIENVDRLDTEMAKVASIKELTDKSIALLDTIGQSGSERHKFIAAYQMTERFQEIEKQILEEDKRLKIIDAKLETSAEFTTLLAIEDVTKLVEVKVDESASSHKLSCALPTPQYVTYSDSDDDFPFFLND